MEYQVSAKNINEQKAANAAINRVRARAKMLHLACGFVFYMLNPMKIFHRKARHYVSCIIKDVVLVVLLHVAAYVGINFAAQLLPMENPLGNEGLLAIAESVALVAVIGLVYANFVVSLVTSIGYCSTQVKKVNKMEAERKAMAVLDANKDPLKNIRDGLNAFPVDKETENVG